MTRPSAHHLVVTTTSSDTPSRTTAPLSSTPGSEQRRRKKKALLIQKQRQAVLQLPHLMHPTTTTSAGHGHSSSNGSYNISALEISYSTSHSPPTTGSMFDWSESSSSTTAHAAASRHGHGHQNHQHQSHHHHRSCRRSSSSASSAAVRARRLKRFVTILVIAVIFCILMLLREKRQPPFHLMTKDKWDINTVGDPTVENLLQQQQQQQVKQKGNNPMQPMGKVSLPATTAMASSSSSTNDKNQNSALSDSATDSTSTNTQANPHSNSNQEELLADPIIISKDSDDTTITSHNQQQQQQQLPPSSSPQTSSLEKPNAKKRPSKPKQRLPSFLQQKDPYDPIKMTLQDPILPSDTSNDHAFVRQYCDLQGSDWFPKPPPPSSQRDSNNNNKTTSSSSSTTPTKSSSSWHQRAPFVMLLGPSHGGSDIVWQLLSTHPQVADAMRSQFFTYNARLFVSQTSSSSIANNNHNHYINVSTTTTTTATSSPAVKVKTRAARRAYMARHVATQRLLQQPGNQTQIVIDNVPETLLYSDQMAPFALCVMPWVKLVIVVSHPIRRLVRHYQAAQRHGLTLSLEDWIARDLERLQQAGLLQPPPAQSQQQSTKSGGGGVVKNATAAGGDKQGATHHEAWTRYQQLTSTAMEASAGQSLYEYMIHPWFTKMEEMGRDPTTEIVIVQEEVLVPIKTTNHERTSTATVVEQKEYYRARVVVEYHRLLRRLGLTVHTPPASLVDQIVVQQQLELDTWKSHVDDDIRQHLKGFFTPYNALLDSFLKSYYDDDGGGNEPNSYGSGVRKKSAKSSGGGAIKEDVLLRWKPELWKNS